MKFFELKMFYLTGLVAVCAGLYLYRYFKNKAKIKKLGDPTMVKAMCSSVSARKRAIKIFLKLAVMMLLITAMARPKAGLVTETVKGTGIDLIIVLDVSKSMLAKDTAPNRFERAKLELFSLIDKLKNDRIGLVLFSGAAFIQMPLTLDYSAAKLFIKKASIDALPRPGTAGSAAINICLDSFKRAGKRTKAIIMFTDGEFHDEGLLDAAEKAKDSAAAIYAVGFGTEVGGPIPVQKKGGVTDFKKDKKGNVVLSKMNLEKLRDITKITGGRYYTTAYTDMVERIIKDFDKLEKKGFEETRYTQFEEKFEIPLVLAGLMLLIESTLSDRKRRRRKK
jgi:Ca-activated chloride channel family protein